MRESIGGTWILSIVVTFLMLFTAYLAVSVNYAKAFRIKNFVISEIETMVIDDTDNSLNVIGSGAFKHDIELYLTNQAYIVQGDCTDPRLTRNYPNYVMDPNLNLMCNPGNADMCGVCVFYKQAAALDDYGDEKYYYTVVDFFKFDLPLIGDFLTFWVRGNSKAV